jgi:hypothetical protein
MPHDSMYLAEALIADAGRGAGHGVGQHPSLITRLVHGAHRVIKKESTLGIAPPAGREQASQHCILHLLRFTALGCNCNAGLHMNVVHAS